MFQPFSFILTDPSTPEGRNWRTFDESSKSLVATNLVFSNPVGLTTCPKGVFTLYGPIVFYSIQISVPNGDGWTVSSYIDLPFSALIHNGVFVAPHIGSCFFNANEAYQTYAYLSSTANPNRLNLAGGYTNATGVTQTPTITGWYFRD